MFLVDGDRHKFLSLLRDVHQRWGTIFHGYCLMGNHYHLEIETPDGSLSAPMKSLNYRYASYLNWRLDRRGHLFDGRFKSVLVDADTYLHQLSRYIHLNPVRAGIVPHPAAYRWSSYCAFIGLATPPPWLATELTLARFGHDEQQQCQAYRDFVETADEVVEDPLRGTVDGAILGSRQFAEVINGSTPAGVAEHRLLGDDGAPSAAALDTLCHAVAREYGVSDDTVRRRWRRRDAEPRHVATYIAARCYGYRLAEVGAYFGRVGASAVCAACKGVESRCAQEPRLAQQIERLVSGTGCSILDD